MNAQSIVGRVRAVVRAVVTGLIVVTATAVALAVWALPAGAAQEAQATAHQAAIDALLSSGTQRPATVREARLIADMVGYQPQIRGGFLENPNGQCSSPTGLPARFEPVCRSHDLGYDLLRAADAAALPLPATARQRIDRRFAQQVRGTCLVSETEWQKIRCTAVAEVAIIAVRANSLRQFDGPPRQESWPWQWS